MRPAHAAIWKSKESQDSNQLSLISLKWFVLSLSNAHDNFLGYCLDPNALLIIKALCSGQFCHSLTSSVSEWHSGWQRVLQVSCWTASAGPDRQTLEVWSDTHSFISLDQHCSPSPSLWPPLLSLSSLLPVTSCVVCTLTPSPPPLLHWYCILSPPYHNHSLSCMSATIVCGHKHLRNVLWLCRPQKHRCSLCGSVYSELVLLQKRDAWLQP